MPTSIYMSCLSYRWTNAMPGTTVTMHPRKRGEFSLLVDWPVPSQAMADSILYARFLSAILSVHSRIDYATQNLIRDVAAER